ncbi:MAG: hypothetical protein GY799_29490 [Desulfobulbaceae bacterium]|nr:hypothetical protein [Desulfobulbaceae bacterium]
MTETIVNPYADIVEAASNAPDAVNMNEVDSTGFTAREPARAGVALFRFKSYIEWGVHEVQRGQGKGKQQPWASIVFELVHPDHMIGEGDKAFPDTLEMTNLNMSRNEKAKFKLLFDDMNYADKYDNFYQMLGQGFLGYIEHNVVNEGTKDEKTYVNLKSIGEPRYEPDPVGQPGVIREVAVPPLYGDIEQFLFDHSTVTADQVKRMWDALEITGDKADGTPKKNWKQDKIRAALNFDGSFTQSVADGTTAVVAEVAAEVGATDPLATLPQETPVDTKAAEAAGATVVDPLADIPGL